MNKRKKSTWKKIIYTVGVIFLISSIVIGFLNLSTNPNTVEKYDRVEIHYMMWEIEEDQTYDIFDPDLNSTDWVTMIPITENESSGLILGLFNNLLGKKLNYKSGLIWLNRCIDRDRNGIDDVTGSPALTYGKDSDDYYNTDLMIQFTIIDIEKDTIIQEWFPDDNIILKTIFTVSQVIFNILYLNFPLIIIVLIMLGTEFLLRQPIKINLKALRKGIIKFGVMFGILCSIPFIVIGIINLTLTPEELNLLISRYDFFIPLIIFIIMISCISFIVIYLILYKTNERRIYRKKRK
ncbi:MAG: hypothetical protein CEE43_12085 [Promethearchaeota archaeon Loki_b32]|nr:MAG: hypothetical protein CEE43_12085 [Candidatus Lokiarchaeota archaeon Loki_b32]